MPGGWSIKDFVAFASHRRVGGSSEAFSACCFALGRFSKNPETATSTLTDRRHLLSLSSVLEGTFFIAATIATNQVSAELKVYSGTHRKHKRRLRSEGGPNHSLPCT